MVVVEEANVAPSDRGFLSSFLAGKSRNLERNGTAEKGAKEDGAADSIKEEVIKEVNNRQKVLYDIDEAFTASWAGSRALAQEQEPVIQTQSDRDSSRTAIHASPIDIIRGIVCGISNTSDSEGTLPQSSEFQKAIDSNSRRSRTMVVTGMSRGESASILEKEDAFESIEAVLSSLVAGEMEQDIAFLSLKKLVENQVEGCVSDLLVCLGEEGEKVNRLQKALEDMGMDTGNILEGITSDSDQKVLMDVTYRLSGENGKDKEEFVRTETTNKCSDRLASDIIMELAHNEREPQKDGEQTEGTKASEKTLKQETARQLDFNLKIGKDEAAKKSPDKLDVRLNLKSSDMATSRRKALGDINNTMVRAQRTETSKPEGIKSKKVRPSPKNAQRNDDISEAICETETVTLRQKKQRTVACRANSKTKPRVVQSNLLSWTKPLPQLNLASENKTRGSSGGIQRVSKKERTGSLPNDYSTRDPNNRNKGRSWRKESTSKSIWSKTKTGNIVFRTSR